MRTAFTRLIAAAAVVMLPLAGKAEPLRLKLSFFGSQTLETYKAGVKPFVDGVNEEGKDLIAIDVFAEGALGKTIAEQPRIVNEGIADIGWIIPGQTPYRFPDNAALDHAGLFRDAREGTLIYTRLIAAQALRGYEDYFVIGAFMPAPNFIHSRNPIGSLAALKGQKIRVNNQVEAEMLERLGATPTVMEVSRLAEAMRRGVIDGVTLAPTALFQYGVFPFTKYHYLLAGSASPLLLVMSRRKFDALPEAARALIRKFSGERAAAAWIASFGAGEERFLAKVKSDPDHKVVEPSPADTATARQIYQSLTDTWAAENSHNRDIQTMIETGLAEIRAAK